MWYKLLKPRVLFVFKILSESKETVCILVYILPRYLSTMLLMCCSLAWNLVRLSCHPCALKVSVQQGKGSVQHLESGMLPLRKPVHSPQLINLNDKIAARIERHPLETLCWNHP